MSHATNYFEELISRFFRTASLTKPAAHYLALFNVVPGEDGTGGVELTGGCYARQRHGPADANWAAYNGVTGELVNLAPVVFPAPTANWLTITGFGLYDALTAGNLLLRAPLETPLQVNLGDPAPAFAPGDLIITLN